MPGGERAKTDSKHLKAEREEYKSMSSDAFKEISKEYWDG